MIFTFYCILWHHSSLLSRNSEENDLPLLEETQHNADKGDLLQNLQQSATNANVNNPDFIFFCHRFFKYLTRIPCKCSLFDFFFVSIVLHKGALSYLDRQLWRKLKKNQRKSSPMFNPQTNKVNFILFLVLLIMVNKGSMVTDFFALF